VSQDDNPAQQAVSLGFLRILRGGIEGRREAKLALLEPFVRSRVARIKCQRAAQRVAYFSGTTAFQGCRLRRETATDILPPDRMQCEFWGQDLDWRFARKTTALEGRRTLLLATLGLTSVYCRTLRKHSSQLPEISQDSAAPGIAGSAARLAPLLEDCLPQGELADIVAYSVCIDLPFKLQMLQEQHVARRAELLLQRLRELVASGAADGGESEFPPTFSEN